MTDDAPNPLKEKQLEIVRTLYPWYKEEVFRRREQMIRLTAFVCAFLVLLLITMLALTPPYPVDPTIKILSITGIALFSALFIYLIHQQKERHLFAKKTLIEIEKLLGLYEKGLYLKEKTLYPKDWQTAWQTDRSITVYVTVIAALAVLVIAAVLVKG